VDARARLAGLTALLTALCVASPAAAREPTAAEAQSALELYKDGKQRRESGDLPKALEKLRAAYALVETPITALELGRTHAMMGHLVEAREILMGVARIPVRKNESTKAKEARAESAKLADELKPRLATLTLKINGAEPSSGATVRVDGVVLPPAAWTAPRIVNPGRHVAEIELGGKKTEETVTLKEGESRDVTVSAPAAGQASTSPPDGPPDTPPPPPPPEPKGGTSPLVYAGFGTAIVGVGVGAVTGILTLSKASSLDETCRDGRCPPSAQADIDSGSTTGTISTVAFIVAGAGVAMGVVGLVLSGKGDAPTQGRATLTFTPGGALIRGSF
jgi:hypothetical protein